MHRPRHPSLATLALASVTFALLGGLPCGAAAGVLGERTVRAPMLIAQGATPPCAEDDIRIPDERAEGASICLKASEWERAKAICAKIAAETGEVADPMACICQDGDQAGACGD